LDGPANHGLDAVQITHEKGKEKFLGKEAPIVKYKDFLP